MDAVINRFVDQALIDAKRIVRDKNRPVLERLSRSMMALNFQSPAGREVMQQMHRPQNALMHQKMQGRMLEGIVPILTELVWEGISSGIFHTPFPSVAVEMCMIYANTAFDEMNVQTPEQRQQRLMGMIDCTERMLGAAEGSLQEALTAAFNDQQPEQMEEE